MESVYSEIERMQGQVLISCIYRASREGVKGKGMGGKSQCRPTARKANRNAHAAIVAFGARAIVSTASGEFLGRLLGFVCANLAHRIMGVC